MSDQQRAYVPPEVLAERASRAIAEMYTGWGPGPLPWAMAERFVSGAIEMAIAQERRASAAWLRRLASEATSLVELGPGRLADRIERGDHLEPAP